MGEIFFTSDLHLCHNKDFIYGPREFKSIDEHDETLIKNWNETVSPEDTVFVLGDIMMGPDRIGGIEKLNRLNGTIVLCRGNHDTDSKMNDYFSRCSKIDQRIMGKETYANVIKIGKWSFYISHHPTIIGDFNCAKSGHKKFCLHGHTHSKDKFQFIQYCCYNVALDAHGHKPVNVKKIQEDIRAEIQRMHATKKINGS